MAKDTKNRGEWSELFAFCKMLLDSKLYFGDIKANPSKKDFIEISGLAHNSLDKIYSIKNGLVEIYSSSGELTSKVLTSSFLDSHILGEILEDIRTGTGRTFAMPKFDTISATLDVVKFKGDSRKKGDLNISYNYLNKIYKNDPVGIKSYIGSPPTLLNSSNETNFLFEVKNFKQSVDIVNGIKTRSAVKDRVKKIYEEGAYLEFLPSANSVHETNLRNIDSLMPEMLSEVVVKYYRGEGSSLSQLVTDAQRIVRFKDYLKAVSLGMFSSIPWDGTYTSNGTIVVHDSGDLVLFHVIQDATLKDYLFNHTKLDTPSTTRYKFGKIFKDNGKLMMKLNLQIRNT